MPQLDGLRAVAITAVMLEHYHLVTKSAVYGVHLFFVLSGFLITGILLHAREAVDASRTTRTDALKRFYIRRALRIFPLYYLVVLVGIAVNADYAREYAPWLLTYTINLKMASQGWYIGNFAHFWSLAVEEQFYLVWPFLILLVPRRWLLTTAVIMTAVGPLYRVWLALAWIFLSSEVAPFSTYIATPTALDSLGIGALVAMLAAGYREKSRPAAVIAIVATVVVVAGAAIANASWALFDTGSALLFGWLIHRGSLGFGGLVGKILGAAPIVYIGRISYGIYVFHPLVPTILTAAVVASGFTAPTKGILAPVSVALTLAVASLSWFAFERPINSLKNRLAPAPR